MQVIYHRAELQVTADGSHTLVHPVIGDTYHSVGGALSESEYVYIGAGLNAVGGNRIKVLEMGFGSGLNALLTLREAMKRNIEIVYHTIELFPVDRTVIESLNYERLMPQELYRLFLDIHSCDWDKEVEITSYFRIKKIYASLEKALLEGEYRVVYYDAFSPDSQPELWTDEMFGKIYDHMEHNGVLVTYSSKGEVKRALRRVGFEVKRLPGALGKHHMVRAVARKNNDVL